MQKFKDFSIAVLFLAAASLIIIIIFTGFSSLGETQKKYEELQDEYYELESKYEETCTTLDNVYYDIGKMMDSMYLLDHYFEDKSISFDEAYKAHDTLCSIIYPYY